MKKLHITKILNSEKMSNSWKQRLGGREVPADVVVLGLCAGVDDGNTEQVRSESEQQLVRDGPLSFIASCV